MNIDVSTGLPELPEGYFWRVKTVVAGAYVKVQIRRKRWFGSVNVEDATMHRSELSPGKVLRWAELAYSNWNRQIENARHPNLLGDYPPKKLEVPE